MAKQKKVKLTPEEKQLEKERIERIRKEELDLKIKVRKKNKRKLERERRVKLKEKKEERRIRKIVRFPFKLLFQGALLFTLLTFIILYFGSDVEVYRALYLSFIIFSSLYLGIGLIMTGVIYFVSQEKIIEMKKNKREEDKKEKERLKNEEEELDKLLRAEVEEMESNPDHMELMKEDTNLLNEDSSAEDMINFDELEKFDDNVENDILDKLNDEFPNENDLNLEGKQTNDEIDSSSSNNLELDKKMDDKEIEPFFAEDDFLNEVVFGNEENKENIG